MRALAVVSSFTILSGVAYAQAATLFNNITATPSSGDCSFSTTCAALVGRGDDYAAQAFSLDMAAKVTSASFAEFDFGPGPTATNWMTAAASGSIPGDTLFSGSSQVSACNSIGSVYGYSISKVDFNVGDASLRAGSYFFAVQVVSPTFNTFLSSGLSTGGAAETHDGGATWSPGYEGFGSVGVALNGTTLSAGPLPASAPLFGAALLALAGLGYGAKRRKVAATAV